jgi:hypothetical protein
MKERSGRDAEGGMLSAAYISQALAPPGRYDHSVPTDGSGNTRDKCEDSIVISALRE